ncbi:MAG: rhodanese-like domain-containing protein [Syntrophobacteraceae bacterium]|nr:rhodanese-like domain-containing protein [Syntrophobacteraceae bacterium]
MRVAPEVEKKNRIFFCSKGLSIAPVTFTAFLSWLPARAGKPLSRGKVLHLDARSLDILVHSDPNLLLIDIRTPAELTGPLGKISQARNVPLEEVAKNPGRFPRDKTLVLICRSGYRSLKAAKLLAKHGYVVYSVEGGMRGWRKLHPQATTSGEGTAPKKHGAGGHTPGLGKPAPPEKFFDNNMGC